MLGGKDLILIIFSIITVLQFIAEGFPESYPQSV